MLNRRQLPFLLPVGHSAMHESVRAASTLFDVAAGFLAST
jgi:hypothetical protein